MGILTRFKDIVTSNINALLDKAEDPAKMIDQYLRNLTEDLAEVKKETAAVMAEETRAKRALDQNTGKINEYEALAKKALLAGNEGDARVLLAKKQELATLGDSLLSTYNVAADNASKMRQMHDKLTSDINSLNARKELIKAKMAVAKTQTKINSYSTDKAQSSVDAFNRMEAKADNMLDRANAEAELNSAPKDDAADIAKKYADAATDANVDADLERLKKEMGL